MLTEFREQEKDESALGGDDRGTSVPSERRTVEQEHDFAAATCALRPDLDRYPKLVLNNDKIPDRSRFYKGQMFELGLPDHVRNHVFFRAQFPPKPAEVEV